MTLTSILKRLNQSTPFDEEQFKGFLQDILGWNEFTIARENLPVHLHEATEEFSRLYTSKRSTTYVWILKLKRQNPHAEQALLDFIAQKESECMVVIRYPEVKNWKLGWVSLIDEQSQYRWMDIGNEYTNHTWAQLLLNHHQATTTTARTFKSHFHQPQLQNILLGRVKQWKRYTLNNLHHSSSAGTFSGSIELCIELFLQVFVLTIIEKKGWLHFGETNDYLRELFKAGGVDSNTFYSSRLKRLFFEGLAIKGKQNEPMTYGEVAFLNGGLFEESKYDKAISDLPDEMFEPLLGENGLFYNYNFIRFLFIIIIILLFLPRVKYILLCCLLTII